MNAQPALLPVIIPSGQGQILRAFGDEIIVHLGSRQTGGQFTMFTDITPPGGGPPPHYHTIEDEWFHVLEGTVSYFVDGKWQDPVGPGGTAYAPRGSIHAFKNAGDRPLRQLITTSPAGFENFFARCGDEFAKPGVPNMERIIAISAEHGIHYVNL